MDELFGGAPVSSADKLTTQESGKADATGVEVAPHIGERNA